MLTPRRLERHAKGIANQRRITILLLLDNHPTLSLYEISDRLKMNFKTGADHTRRLVSAGLIKKRRKGSHIEHSLTPRGKVILEFLRTLE